MSDSVESLKCEQWCRCGSGKAMFPLYMGRKSKIGTVRKTETDAKWSRDKTLCGLKEMGSLLRMASCDWSHLLVYLAAFLLLNSVRHPWILITYPSFFVRLECVLIIHDSQKIMMHWVSMVLLCSVVSILLHNPLLITSAWNFSLFFRHCLHILPKWHLNRIFEIVFEKFCLGKSSPNTLRLSYRQR